MQTFRKQFCCKKAKFIYNNQPPAGDTEEVYDVLQAKCDIDSAIELSNYINDNIRSVVEAKRKLNMSPCPCCGDKTHTIQEPTILKRRSL
jgi:hypothetical protein